MAQQSKIQLLVAASQGLSKQEEWGSLIQLIQQLEVDAQLDVANASNADEFRIRQGIYKGIKRVRETLLIVGKPIREVVSDVTSREHGSEQPRFPEHPATTAIGYADRGF